MIKMICATAAFAVTVGFASLNSQAIAYREMTTDVVNTMISTAKARFGDQQATPLVQLINGARNAINESVRRPKARFHLVAELARAYFTTKTPNEFLRKVITPGSKLHDAPKVKAFIQRSAEQMAGTQQPRRPLTQAVALKVSEAFDGGIKAVQEVQYPRDGDDEDRKGYRFIGTVNNFIDQKVDSQKFPSKPRASHPIAAKVHGIFKGSTPWNIRKQNNWVREATRSVMMQQVFLHMISDDPADSLEDFVYEHPFFKELEW